jgi:N-acetylmuramoyl-L-alanine amidase
MRRTPGLIMLFRIILLFTLICSTPSPVTSLDLSTVSIVPIDNIPYVSIIDLAETYNLKIDYDPGLNSMTVIRGDNTLKLHNLSRHMDVNNAVANLMAPARLFHGSMYVPAATFCSLFSAMVPGTIAWDEKEWALSSSGSVGSVRTIDFEKRLHGTLIRIGMTELLDYEDILQDTGSQKWLHVKLKNGVLDPDSLVIAQPLGMVNSVRTTARDGEMFVSFLVADNMERYDITGNHESEEIMISLREKRAMQLANNDLSGNIPGEIPFDSTHNGDIWIIDTIVVDPGHGGRDPGAVGPKGTKEKDIVLAISKELKKIADKRGEIKTILTRSDDTFLSLRKRAHIAIENNGKLFISIHANSTRNKRVSGMEVYFLSQAKEESAKRVAELENASAKLEDNPDYYASLASLLDNEKMPQEIKEIYGDMAFNAFLTESQNMCSILLDSAISKTRQKNRGVKQAPFYVMLGTQAAMPSVLFEIGFISNANEEKLLKRASHQRRIAESIYNAVITFKRIAEKDLITMSGSN